MFNNLHHVAVGVCAIGIALSFPLSLVQADVVINEFSSGSTSDWIEVYNSGDTADLSFYKLRDSGTNVKDLDGEIGPGAFVSFSFSNWLNNTGDTVRLMRVSDGGEEEVDHITYGEGGICAPSASQTIGRQPDGSAAIVRFSSGSQNASNNSSTQEPCPTPSPTPTLTPMPTLTPTNTPSSTPTHTPTKTPTPSKTPTTTKTPTPSLKKSPTPTGEQSEPPTPEEESGEVESAFIASESSPLESESRKKVLPLVISLLFVSVGSALLALVFIWKKRHAMVSPKTE